MIAPAPPHRSLRRSVSARGPRMPAAPLLALWLACAASACAPLPDISAATQTPPGPAPALVPLSGILAQADAVGSGQTSVDATTARADALRARADALRAD